MILRFVAVPRARDRFLLLTRRGGFPVEPRQRQWARLGRPRRRSALAERKAAGKPRTFSADAARNPRRPSKSRQYTLAPLMSKSRLQTSIPLHTRMRAEPFGAGSGGVAEALHNGKSPQASSFRSESHSKNWGVSLHCSPNSPPSQRRHPSSATSSVTMLLQLYSWDGFKVHTFGSHFVQMPAHGPFGVRTKSILTLEQARTFVLDI